MSKPKYTFESNPFCKKLLSEEQIKKVSTKARDYTSDLKLTSWEALLDINILDREDVEKVLLSFLQSNLLEEVKHISNIATKGQKDIVFINCEYPDHVKLYIHSYLFGTIPIYYKIIRTCAVSTKDQFWLQYTYLYELE